MTQRLDLAGKDLETAILTMLEHLKERIVLMREHMGRSAKKIETVNMI